MNRHFDSHHSHTLHLHQTISHSHDIVCNSISPRQLRACLVSVANTGRCPEGGQPSHKRCPQCFNGMRCMLRGMQLSNRGLRQQVNGPQPTTRSRPAVGAGAKRRMHGGADTSQHTFMRRAWMPLAAGASGGLACGGCAAYGISNYHDAPVAFPDGVSAPVPASMPAWVHAFASREGLIQALDTESLRSHKGPMSVDHWFSSLVQHHHLREMTMYYDPDQMKLFCVVSLGTDVCGFPTIVHGGLTAAIFDETFGGLLFALKRQRRLPFWGPAFTAQLDITYRSKIAAGQSILCTAEVESVDGRKVWLRAIMSDGPGGKVFATARALFVAPKPHRLLKDVLQVVTPSWLGGGPNVAP